MSGMRLAVSKPQPSQPDRFFLNAPLVVWIIGALESAAVMGGLSALGAAMYSVGIPKNSVLQYETHVKSGKLLLVAHGSPEEVERAKDILDQSDADSTTVHGELLTAAGV